MRLQHFLPFVWALTAVNAAGTISSISKQLCGTDCTYDDSSTFSTCYTQSGWDFCSPSPITDFEGNECIEPCKLFGGVYECRIPSYSWFPWWPLYGLCSVTSPEPVHLDHRGNVCTSACTNIGYFFCNSMTPDGRQTAGYCSPSKNVDCLGRPCIAYKNDMGITSCQHQDGSWEFNGVVEDDACPGERAINSANKPCEIINNLRNGQHVVHIPTEYGRVAGPRTRDEERYVKNLVAHFKMGENGFEPTAKKPIVENVPNTGNMRLDLQGETSDGYANIAIQTDGLPSVNMAQVLVPRNVPVSQRATRRALLLSAKWRKTVKMVLRSGIRQG